MVRLRRRDAVTTGSGRTLNVDVEEYALWPERVGSVLAGEIPAALESRSVLQDGTAHCPEPNRGHFTIHYSLFAILLVNPLFAILLVVIPEGEAPFASPTP